MRSSRRAMCRSGSVRRQPRLALRLVHPLQLLRRPGQQNHDLPVPPHHGVDVLARRAAIGVFHHLRAVQPSACFALFGGIAMRRAAKRLYIAARMSLSRCSRSPSAAPTASRVRSSSVGPSPPREHHNVRPRNRSLRRTGQVRQVVPDDGLERHLHAKLVQLRRQVERVGVLPERRQHLRPGSNNLSNHGLFVPSSRPEPRSGEVEGPPHFALALAAVKPAVFPQYPKPHGTARPWSPAPRIHPPETPAPPGCSPKPPAKPRAPA